MAQEDRPANRKSRRPSGAWLASSVAAMLVTAPAAFADGLVVRSTSGAYARGDRIASGQVVRLAAGEQIEVLDQSGARKVIDASGPYRSDSARTPDEAGRLDALRAAVWAERRSDMGASRSGDLDACLASISVTPGRTEAECRRAFTDGPPPKIDVRLREGGTILRPAAPMALEITTTFDAVVACVVNNREASDGYPLALGGDRLWVQVKPGQRMQPDVSAATMQGPAANGSYRLSCRAVDISTWSLVADAAPAASFDDLSALLASYVALRKSPAAETAVDFSVHVSEPASTLTQRIAGDGTP